MDSIYLLVDLTGATEAERAQMIGAAQSVHKANRPAAELSAQTNLADTRALVKVLGGTQADIGASGFAARVLQTYTAADRATMNAMLRDGTWWPEVAV